MQYINLGLVKDRYTTIRSIVDQLTSFIVQSSIGASEDNRRLDITVPRFSLLVMNGFGIAIRASSGGYTHHVGTAEFQDLIDALSSSIHCLYGADSSLNSVEISTLNKAGNTISIRIVYQDSQFDLQQIYTQVHVKEIVGETSSF